jgi:hypothetical protein
MADTKILSCTSEIPYLKYIRHFYRLTSMSNLCYIGINTALLLENELDDLIYLGEKLSELKYADAVSIYNISLNKFMWYVNQVEREILPALYDEREYRHST